MGSPLLLRLDYCRGIKIDKFFEVNEIAFMTKDEIYNIHIDSPLSLDSALCIQPLASAWRLLNQSSEVFCAINGITLAPNHWCQLHEGDVLQWGLSIWQINPTELLFSAPPSVTIENDNTNNSAIPLDLTWFDPRRPPMHEVENPFDLITASMPYELVESTKSNDTTSSNPESTASMIFHELLEEYRQALDNPGLQDSDYIWQDQLLKNYSSGSNTNVTLTDLAKNLDPLTTLQDIVSGPLHIDDVFNGLDSLRETELFQIEEPPEVLRLFAPGWQLHSDTTHMPPSLTRREHHTVSVNSHYHMSHSSHFSIKDSADDNHKPQ